MSNALVKSVLIGLLLLAAIAPFAGLAPLTIFLLVWGVSSALGSLLRSLFIGEKAFRPISKQAVEGRQLK